MWIDTTYDDIPRLFNSQMYAEIYIEFHVRQWEILIRKDDASGDVLGIFDKFDDALREYRRLAQAVRHGKNYHKVISKEEHYDAKS